MPLFAGLKCYSTYIFLIGNTPLFTGLNAVFIQALSRIEIKDQKRAREKTRRTVRNLSEESLEKTREM